MASWVQIANAALIAIGSEKINDLTESNEAARLCNARYEDVLDAVLEEYPWNCTITRAVDVAADVTAPDTDYDYRYQLPTVPYCLRLLAVYKDGTALTSWQISGRYVECDEEAPVTLKYIGRITDPNQIDPIIREAISARLAAEIAYKLTGSKALAEGQWQIYQFKLKKARLVDAMASTVADTSTSTWITDRG